MSGPGRLALATAAWLLGGVLALGAGALAAPHGPESAVPPAAAGDGDASSSSTREMAALLRERAALVDPLAVPYPVNDRTAELLGEMFAKPMSLDDRMTLRVSYARELLNSGQNERALMVLRALEEDARAFDPGGWRRSEAAVRMLEAVAHLRTGEEQNCCNRNNRDSCLFPIRGEGIHESREGSTRAVEVLKRVLEITPEDLHARWLLNIAHMTLGDYPAGVPARHRIPPEAFASEYPLPPFVNVARDAGLDIFGQAGGAVLDDLDGDGLLDVMVTFFGLEDQMRLFRNRGDGSFEERTAAAGLTGEVSGGNLVHADYDNDGHLDVLVLRGAWMGSEGRFPLSLLRNRGDGSFTDVTREAGLLRLAPSQTAAWFDYDGDGWLDLFVGNESTDRFQRPCELFHNEGDGTFREVARAAGVDLVAYVKGVVSGDYDNDGRPDLYLSVWDGPNHLFRNEGPAGEDGGWRFTDAGAAAGVTEPRKSFPTFFFDYDNDGWLDLFVAGYGETTAEAVAADYLGLPAEAERGRLYHNRGDGTFEDVTKEAGLYEVVFAMGLNFGDLDNDGWLDFYAGTGTPKLSMLVPNRMFRNAEGRTFQDVTTAGNFGHLQKGHGVCFGDVDNDGDQDVFEQMGGAVYADRAYSALYENPGSGNAWLGLELEGVRSNRGAVGARVEVAVDTPAGRRSLHRVVGTGGSFGSSPLRLEVGLGDAERIAWVAVRWPATGETQKLEGLAPRRRYRIREGSPRAEEIERPLFALAPDAKVRALRDELDGTQ